ncbi:MAG: twin-arginine translocase subunit TatC [Bryobacteraceae bacterium]|jgi:sec-independent protein translocase protein TatC
MDSSEEQTVGGEPPRGSTPAGGALARARRRMGGGPPPPPPPGGEEEEGMLRMSFLEHLEELRRRIISALIGIGVSFCLSFLFCDQLWNIIKQPAVTALKSLGYEQRLVQITPMETLNIIWFKLPLVCSLFIASPWVVYQVWAFISPGLYRKERRWAVPFIVSSAGLFILGGLFAYFVAFRFALTFLLGMGHGKDIAPFVSVSEYFAMFVNVVLGIGLVFELPVVIFFLTLLRIVTPSFLIKHSRYAILIIFIIAAIVTPTPDAFNMMLFALPMCLLFYLGVFAAYLLTLHRENRRFPWKTTIIIVMAVLLLLGAWVYISITRHAIKVVPHWPFLLH